VPQSGTVKRIDGYAPIAEGAIVGGFASWAG
jgi:hypothetical protein